MIKEALSDCHVSAAKRLSLTQRARRILQSKSVAKKRKIASTAAEPHDYSLDDFPDEDLTQAPEVSSCKQPKAEGTSIALEKSEKVISV